MNIINKIGLGSVQFGMDYGISNHSGITTIDEVRKILSISRLNGIDIIDTAIEYGSSQQVLGQFNLNKFKVISKFYLNENEKTISRQLKSSLQLLSLDTLYGYLAHRPLSIIENPRLWDELLKFKDLGFIKKIGFSFNEVFEIEQILNAGFEPDIIQVPYNYFDQRFENYMVDLKGNGCEIHTRSTFLQGLFFCNINELNSFFNEVKPLISELQNFEEDLAGNLLRWVCEKEFVDKVIVGVNNSIQLKNNIKSLKTFFERNTMPSFEIPISDEILMPSKWPK